MPILDINNKELKEKYKEFLIKNKYSDLMQSIEWAKLKDNWICEVVYLMDENNEFIATSTVLLRKIPVINSYIAYCPRGPILSKRDSNLLDDLLKEFGVLRRKYNIFCVRFDPNWKKEEINKKEFKKLKFRDKVSTKKIFQPKLNMILGLENYTEQELFDSFSQTTRRNIRIALKNNCEVVQMTNLDGLDIFYDIHKITGKRDNFLIRSKEYFENMYNIFKDSGILKIWLVKHEGEVLGATISLEYGNTMWYYAGASSNEKRDFRPNHLIQWEMIKYAKEKNYAFYNFGGIYSVDPKIEPLYIFKSGFCKKDGVTEYIGEMDYVYSKIKYVAYLLLENLNILKKKIIKLIRRIKNSEAKENQAKAA